MAVETAGDDSEKELKTSTDHTRYCLEGLEPSLAHGLSGLGALVEGMTTGLSTEFLLISGAEFGGRSSEGSSSVAELDGGLAGLDSVVKLAHDEVGLLVLKCY